MSTVHVQNIGAQTSEKEVRDFFSFCGKISSLSVTPSSNDAQASKSASVTFEKESAAKTALLLDQTQLGSSQVHVSPASSIGDIAGEKSAAAGDEHAENLSQDDKPRSRIFAEYLAHGYTISDKAIERALALDQQHGISNRFTKTLTDFDSKYKASEKAQQMDQKYGVSQRAAVGWNGLQSYFDKAMGTPTGQRVRAFYVQGNKQVMDVHNEARHLADLKSGKSEPHPVSGGQRTQCSCHADTGKCGCAPGTCACSSCVKNPEVSTSKIDAETAGLEVVPGTDGKTHCNCGGSTDKCPCEAGKCTCASCPKAAATKA